MNDQAWFNRIALIAVVTVIASAGVATYLGQSSAGSPRAAPAAAGPGHLYLTYAFNAGNGLDQVFPANFTVASHVPVFISITNYDNGTNPIPMMNAQVRGTVGPVNRMMMGSMMGGSTFWSLSSDAITHTFTMMSGSNLNVPIPPAADLSHPSVLTFVAYFNSTGAFQWMCLAPCDGTAMVSLGFMTGTVTVT
jgi:hypothetical protein